MLKNNKQEDKGKEGGCCICGKLPELDSQDAMNFSDTAVLKPRIEVATNKAAREQFGLISAKTMAQLDQFWEWAEFKSNFSQSTNYCELKIEFDSQEENNTYLQNIVRLLYFPYSKA